jgi:hypothetical protein
MKRLLTIVVAASAMAALSAATPALAKSKQQPRHSGYEQSFGDLQNGWNGGWQRRADPSFSNQAAIRNAQRSGRCVEDLGYGRYDYCGW